MFFTMNNPFAYISATQALDKTPLEYAAGAAFDLNFLVTTYDAVKSAMYLNDRAGQWLKQRRSGNAPKAKKTGNYQLAVSGFGEAKDVDVVGTARQFP